MLDSIPYPQRRRNDNVGLRLSSFPIMLCCYPQECVCTSAVLACKKNWHFRARECGFLPTSPALWHSHSLPSASIQPTRAAQTSANRNRSEHSELSQSLRRGDRSVCDWSLPRPGEEAVLWCKAGHGNALGPQMPSERLSGWTWDQSETPVLPSPPVQWHDPARSLSQKGLSARTRLASAQNTAPESATHGPEPEDIEHNVFFI